MEKPSQVAYVGADADAVAERWHAEDRPFALVPFGPGEWRDGLENLDRVDGVVCRDEGDVDVEALAGAAVRYSSLLPVVVLAGEDGIDAADALAAAVAHYVAVDADDDAVDLLTDAAPLVERHRERRRERSMLDSLLEHIPLSVYFKDRQSRHLRVSEAMTSMTPPDYVENEEGKRFHTAADVVGNTDYDLYPPELAEDAVADDRTVLETEAPIEDRLEHSFGTTYDGTYVTTSKAPWYDEHGDVVGVVGVTRDVSERKQYEHQLERQNERLERFAKVLSHDLRNPLEVARGRLSFARDTGDDEHFAAIERSLDRMDRLIEDVLALARQGEAVEDPVAVDLETVATDAWAVVDSDDAELVVDTEATVLADPGRLSRLLENLFRNAVEHGAREDDPLTVTVGDLPQRRGFYVADDGVGIPDVERESVFDPGFTTDDGGTGLGLNIVRTIADAHGWHVSVGDADEGARFDFENVRSVDG